MLMMFDQLNIAHTDSTVDPQEQCYNEVPV